MLSKINGRHDRVAIRSTILFLHWHNNNNNIIIIYNIIIIILWTIVNKN